MAISDIVIYDSKDSDKVVATIPGTSLRDIANIIGQNISVKGGGGDKPAYSPRTASRQDYGYQALQDFKGTALPGVTAISTALKQLGDASIMGKLGLTAVAEKLDDMERTVTRSISIFQRQSLTFFRSFDQRIRKFRTNVKDSFGGLTSLSDQATNKLADSLTKG